MLYSRNGARKVLGRYLLEIDTFEIGDPNGDISIDHLISNVKFTHPFEVERHNYVSSFLPSRDFQSYTFMPDIRSPASQNFEAPSTWQ